MVTAANTMCLCMAVICPSVTTPTFLTRGSSPFYCRNRPQTSSVLAVVSSTYSAARSLRGGWWHGGWAWPTPSPLRQHSVGLPLEIAGVPRALCTCHAPYLMSPPSSHQFSEADLLAMGHDLCEAIHKYHKFKKSKRQGRMGSARPCHTICLLYCSYQQKVHAQLAELIMANLERDRLPRPSTPPPVNLPDIVTSSTPPTITLTPSHGPKPHGHGKKQRSRHSKVLQRFCRFDMALLEEESRYKQVYSPCVSN